jgi:hypothetical protein
VVGILTEAGAVQLQLPVADQDNGEVGRKIGNLSGHQCASEAVWAQVLWGGFSGLANPEGELSGAAESEAQVRLKRQSPQIRLREGANVEILQNR